MEKKWIWTLKNWAYKITHPSVWITVDRRTDYTFEKMVREAMENRTLRLVVYSCIDSPSMRAYEPTIGQIWVGNYPYGFGSLYAEDSYGKQPAVSERFVPKLKAYLDAKDVPVIKLSELYNEARNDEPRNEEARNNDHREESSNG
jgi:hypothetical protein